MLITTKNGKVIARVIALAMCAIMLLAFGTGCSDEAKARAEEAYNAALKAEEAANKANQAASDAQNSANNAMEKAEGAETLAGTKLTEAEVTAAITEALATYAKSADVVAKADFAAELAKILTEESIKAWIKAGDDAIAGDANTKIEAVKTEVNTLVNETLKKFQTIADSEAAQAALEKKITDLTATVLANQTSALGALDTYKADQNAIKAAACEQILANFAAKDAKIAEIKADNFYNDAAIAAVERAYDIAMVELLTATSNEAIEAAGVKLEAAISADQLPSIIDDYVLNLIALEEKAWAGGIIIDIANDEFNLGGGDNAVIYEMYNTMTELLANPEFVAAHPNAFGEYENGDVWYDNVKLGIEGQYAQVKALEAAWADAEKDGGVNELINALAAYLEPNNAKYEKKDELNEKIAEVDAAISTWIMTNFGRQQNNANIERMLYNRYVYLEDKVNNDEVDTAKDLAAHYTYLEDYANKINALVGTGTNWNGGAEGAYLLMNEKAAIDALKAEYDANETAYGFQTALAFADEYALLTAAYDYAAYAQTLADAFNAEGSTVAAALNGLAAHQGTLTITTISDFFNNPVRKAAQEYNIWNERTVTIDETTYETRKYLNDKTIADILGAELVADLKWVEARANQLTKAQDAAAILNAGGNYKFVKAETYSNLGVYYTYNAEWGYYEICGENWDGKIDAFEPGVEYYTAVRVENGIYNFFDDYSWMDHKDIDVETFNGKYYSIIELELIQELAAEWLVTYEIENDPENDNYNMIAWAALNAAEAKANALIDAILDHDTTKAFELAMKNFFDATNDGTDFSKLYGYVLLDAAMEACNNWYFDEELNITITVGIKKFEDRNLDTVIADLHLIKNNDYLGANGTLTNATNDYKADLYAAFANFDLEAYNPSIYDSYVVAAYENAKAWAEKYLDETNMFTVPGTEIKVDRIGLLTEAQYNTVMAAYAKYDAYVTNNALAELTAIETALAAFKNGENWKVNILKDDPAIAAIEADMAEWTEAYIKVGATGTIDKRLEKHTAVAADVVALRAEYTAILTAVQQYVVDSKLNEKVMAIAEVDLYSKVDTTDALYIAREAYNGLKAVIKLDDISSAAFAGATNTKFVSGLKGMVLAIESAEAAVDELAAAKNAAGETFCQNVLAQLPTDYKLITPAHSADIKALLAEYAAWKEGVDMDFESTKTVYNTNEIETAYDHLMDCKIYIEEMVKALDQVIADLEALKKLDTPDKAVGSTNFADVKATYVAAFEKLEASIEAYTKLNSAAIDENGKLAAVDAADFATKLTAAQINDIYVAAAIVDSIPAMEAAQAVYVEYETEAGLLGANDKLTSLASIRDNMIKKIMDDAALLKASDEAKVGAFVRAQMQAVMAADGTVTPPVFDDFEDDYEDWKNPVVATYDFVTNFGTYAGEWGSSYTEHSVASSDLGDALPAASINFSAATKQGSTVTDRPVIASADKNADPSVVYVTYSLTESGKSISEVTFNVKKWSDKKYFSSIVVEYKDAEGNWIVCRDALTLNENGSLANDEEAVVGTIEAEGVTEVRLVVTASKRQQLGITSIVATVK